MATLLQLGVNYNMLIIISIDHLLRYRKDDCMSCSFETKVIIFTKDSWRIVTLSSIDFIIARNVLSSVGLASSA